MHLLVFGHLIRQMKTTKASIDSADLFILLCLSGKLNQLIEIHVVKYREPLLSKLAEAIVESNLANHEGCTSAHELLNNLITVRLL